MFGTVVDARCKDCEDNDCNRDVDCADSACASSAACACDYGTCANDEKPEWYMSGASCTYRCVHNDLCLPQINPCAPDASACAALAPSCPDTSLSLGGSVCCYNYARFNAGSPVAYCCYTGRDPDKETCPAGGTSCSYDALGNPVLINNNGNNICDPSHGWKCDGTSQAVGCCGDTDCAGQYGSNHVKKLCDCPTVGSCTYAGSDQKGDYTCKAPSTCRCYCDCASEYCCSDNTPSCTTTSPNTGKSLCESVGTTELGTYLCASASPTSWHECNASTVGQNYRNSHSSYICLKENGNYSWVEITNLKLVMITLAVLFFVPLVLKKFK